MSKKNIHELFDSLKNENLIFLSYLKAKFPLFHNSNFFARDFQYGLMGFLEKKGVEITFNEAAELYALLTDYYEKQGIFIKTSLHSWKLNYPDFVTTKPGDPFSF
jgi:hypothetical protein